MGTRDAFDSLRQPEYTGDDRCTPCTIVNVAIATVVAAGAYVVSPPLAAGAFAAFLGVIYLRGYLVPGTPWLTKRYLPDRVLARFDKAPDARSEYDLPAESDAELDAEAVLVEVGALEPNADGSDLRLVDEFQETWQTRVGRLREDGAVRDAFAESLDVPPDRVSLYESDSSVVASVAGGTVGRWESRAAYVADVAADRVLVDGTPGWSDLPVERRSNLLASLRIFLERCPECEGQVEMRKDVVESCCRSRETIVSRCRDCGSVFFEVESDRVDASPGDR